MVERKVTIFLCRKLCYTVEDLYNVILYNAMIHITQKFLSVNNHSTIIEILTLSKKKEVQNLK